MPEYSSHAYLVADEDDTVLPPEQDFPIWGKTGVVDWLLALYLVAVGAMTATPIWYVSTYIAYGVALAFVFTLDYGRAVRIPSFWLFVGLAVWLFVTASRSLYPFVSMNAAWYIIKIIVFSLILMARCTSLSRLIFYLKATIIGMLTLAVCGAIMGYPAAVQGGAAVMGLTTEENAFGVVLFTGLLVGMVLLPCVGKKWKVLVWIYFVAAFVSLLASASRGASMACFMAVVTYFILEHIRYIRQNLTTIIPMFMLIIGVPIIAVRLFPHALLVQRLSTLYYEGRAATSGRLDIYEHAWGLFLSHKFFGIGPGMYRAHSVFVYTHTTFLEFLVTTGILGFVLYYACYLHAWLLLGRLLRAFKQSNRLRKLLNSCRSVLIATVIFGAFLPVHYEKGLSFLLAIIIGFAARCCWQLKQYQQPLPDANLEGDHAQYAQTRTVDRTLYR